MKKNTKLALVALAALLIIAAVVIFVILPGSNGQKNDG